MASRPVFVPNAVGRPLVDEISVEFRWHSGFSIAQRQRCVSSLHEEAADLGLGNILEISTKSESELGRNLSAFNLRLTINNGQIVCVESAYQGSKVFRDGGPFQELYSKSAREARKDPRLRNSGYLVSYAFIESLWQSEPKTAFYNWLYVSALRQNPDLSAHLPDYDCFSDIEFNPARSINCQARAAALFVTLQSRKLLDLALVSQDSFIRVTTGEGALAYEQGTLFE